MACLCGGSNGGQNEVACKVTGLTPSEKNAVRESWKVGYADWDTKTGIDYFMWLFKKMPKVQNMFEEYLKMTPGSDHSKNETLKAHVILFGGALNGLVVNLDNTDALVAAINRLTDSHVKRGVTVEMFKDALTEFLNFMVAMFKINKLQKNSWAKTANVVVTVIDARVKEIKK